MPRIPVESLILLPESVLRDMKIRLSYAKGGTYAMRMFKAVDAVLLEREGIFPQGSHQRYAY